MNEATIGQFRRIARRLKWKRRQEAWQRNITLRPCDVPACVAFNRDGLNWEAADFVSWLSTPYVEGRVALNEDDQLVGFIVYERRGAGAVHLRNIAIDPAYRRRGFARRLLNDLLFRENWPTVTVDVCEVDVAALEYFKAAGFDAAPGEREAYERDGVLRDA